MNHKLNIKTRNEKAEDKSENFLEGFAQIIQGKLWVHFKGQTFVTEQNKGTSRRRVSEGKSAQNQICAPMPGKITKIFVEIDQELEPGEAIVVMEAMKMEYTLKCEAKNSVEKIFVSVGDQVPLGQVLVKLKAKTQ